MTEQPVLDVFRLQRLAKQRVGAQVQHAHAKVVAGPPVCVHPAQLFRRQGGFHLSSKNRIEQQGKEYSWELQCQAGLSGSRLGHSRNVHCNDEIFLRRNDEDTYLRLIRTYPAEFSIVLLIKVRV